MHKLHIMTIGLALTLAVDQADATLVVNTGTPNGADALALDASNWLAGQFSLANAMTVTAISGYLDQRNQGDTFTVALYDDAANLPGTELFSGQAAYVDTGWNGLSGLSWDLAAGTYWAALEVRADTFGGPLDSFSGVATLAAPNPLAGTAYNDGGVRGYQVADLSFGLQVDAVPEPETYALLLVGMGLTRIGAPRRHR
jgi:hypothetical protein